MLVRGRYCLFCHCLNLLPSQPRINWTKHFVKGSNKWRRVGASRVMTVTHQKCSYNYCLKMFVLYKIRELNCAVWFNHTMLTYVILLSCFFLTHLNQNSKQMFQTSRSINSINFQKGFELGRPIRFAAVSWFPNQLEIDPRLVPYTMKNNRIALLKKNPICPFKDKWCLT